MDRRGDGDSDSDDDSETDTEMKTIKPKLDDQERELVTDDEMLDL